MRRVVRWGAVAVLVAAVFVSAASAIRLWQGERAIARIAALGAGQDVTGDHGSDPAVLAAQGLALVARGKSEAAQAVADRLDGAPAEHAAVLYAIANARMRAALGIFTQVPFRVIKGSIAQAKAEYRQAIQLDPDNWDARYNYAIAAALVRDTESSTPSAGDEMAHERAAWPDIPGAPNGMP